MEPRRQFSNNEKPHYLFDQNKGVHAYNKYFYVKAGVIMNVDYDRYTVDVSWIHSDGARAKIPVSFPYAGPAGCIGNLPEIGSIGIFGFYDEGGGHGSPLLLAYLPSGLSSGLDHNTVKTLPDALPTDDVNEIAYKFRPLREGDMIVSSPKGGGLFVNNSIELYDSEKDMLMIREDDQAIIANSISNFVFTDGASIVLGPAVRNGLVLYDDHGVKNPDHPATASTGSSGRETIYMTPGGKPIDNNTQYYPEFRVDVDDLGNGKLDLNDINGHGTLAPRDPVVTMALGNYIGANIRNGLQYGRILKPVLFKSPNDKDGDFTLAIAAANNGLNEPELLGLAYALHFQKSGSFIGVDKEGHLYVNLARSNSNPMGAGRSMSILAHGNLKEIWGADAASGNAWDLTTKGGVVWDIGKSGANASGRSIDISTDSGVSFRYGAEDDSGYAKQEDAMGDVRETVGGTHTTVVGAANYTVNGLKSENVTGSSSEIVQGDKTINVMGVFTETVVKEKQGKYGSRKTTITTGNDETELLAGSMEETIKIGHKSTSVRSIEVLPASPTVAIEQTVGAGNIESKITAGKYVVEVTAGSIEIKTTAGTISVNGTSIDIKATAIVSVSAPLVKIAQGALVGGVVSGLPGKPNHYDYMSGAPLKGSMKVSVG